MKFEFMFLENNYRFRQKNGVNKISTVKSSSLPMSIKKLLHHFAKLGNDEQLFTGPKSPKAGPTLPRLDADKPTDDLKSIPSIENIKAPIINDNIYKMKKAKTLNTILLEIDFLL